MPDSAMSFINKYRPQTFLEVIGHEQVISSLIRVIAQDTCPHSFLLTGPSGIGKTTIARIIADELAAEAFEVDAASNNGVNETKDLVDLAQYKPLSGAKSKLFILDEAHALSRNAWQPLLKIIEEPPSHLYFAFCTTEIEKVPETIFTRCYHVKLDRLKDREIEDLLTTVIEIEGWAVDNDVLSMVIQSATGQPRKALATLQACYDAPSKDEAARIIRLMDDPDILIDFIKLLLSGNNSWSIIQPKLKELSQIDFSDVGAARYAMTVMLASNDEKRSKMAWQLLEALVFPASTFDKKAAFMAAIGRFFWS